MKKKELHVRSRLAWSTLTACCFWLGPAASAQSVAQNNSPVQDSDTTRQELARFDQFLDGHREIAEQLRKDPSLVNNEQYVKDHPQLQAYLQQHPGIREEIKENPNAFMHQEQRFDRREDGRDRDTTRQELGQFDQFLDRHREVSEQLRKDPSLVNNEQYLKDHPELQVYLQQHPAVREEIKENPNAFMHQEERFDRREDGRDRDTTRQEVAQFDQFLDRHREVSEQLRKDPSLVNNERYVKDHPELQAYLQQHPAVREEIKENPNAFMHQEQLYDRSGDARDRERDRGDNSRDADGRDNDNRDRDADRRDNDNRDRDANRRDNDNRDRDANRRDNDNRDRDADRRDNDNRDRDADRRDNDNRNRDADRRDNDNRDRDARRDNDNRQDRGQFDKFLDNHREIAEQVRKNPSLVNDERFVKDHPALKTYLQEHPEIRKENKEELSASLRQEDQMNHREGGVDREANHRQFGEFLGGHSDISKQLSKDPSLVKNQEYVENHPELRDYLKAHPEVKEQLMENPQSFVKSAQQFSSNNKKAPTVKQKP